MKPGFEIIESVLSSKECDGLTAHIELRGRAGTRHLMQNPAVQVLSRRPELLAIAQRYVGPGATSYRGTLFAKSGHGNWLVTWHQDTALPLTKRFESPEWGPWSKKENVEYAHAPTWAFEHIVALRVHLDASTRNNGPLRVIPGSHLEGVMSDEAVGQHARTHAPVDCEVLRGGVLVMHPLLIHASSKSVGEEPRRVLHLEYAGSLQLAAGIRLAVT